RCPDCTARNSVAAKLCGSCGHKFKRKAMPLQVKLIAGGVVGVAALVGIAAAVIPSLVDTGNSLTRTAKQVANGPKSADEAVKMRKDLDQAVSKYLKEVGKLNTRELATKLQQELHSNTYEVHAFDLKRGL